MSTALLTSFDATSLASLVSWPHSSNAAAASQSRSNFRRFDLAFPAEAALEKAKEAQRFAEVAAQAVHDRREDYHRLSEDYEVTEDDLNEELGCIRARVHCPAERTTGIATS